MRGPHGCRVLLVEPLTRPASERGEQAAVLLEAQEQRRDRGRGVHQPGDERRVAVEARGGELRARECGGEGERRELEAGRQRGDRAARRHPLGVGLIGALLAEATQRHGDAALQLADGLLQFFEAKRVEGLRIEAQIVSGHGLLYAELREAVVGLWRHLVVFAALIVNLWVGGDLVEALAGHYTRGLFELLLIFGYLWFVVGLSEWLRRSPNEERPPGGDRRS